MSGSSGGGGAGSGGGGFEFTDCSQIIERTILNSPDPAVIRTLSVKDILAVIVSDAGGATRVLVQNGSNIAGSITFGKLAALIDCIQQGNQYVAVVEQINGGSCTVQIRPESLV